MNPTEAAAYPAAAVNPPANSAHNKHTALCLYQTTGTDSAKSTTDGTNKTDTFGVLMAGVAQNSCNYHCTTSVTKKYWMS